MMRAYRGRCFHLDLRETCRQKRSRRLPRISIERLLRRYKRVEARFWDQHVEYQIASLEWAAVELVISHLTLDIYHLSSHDVASHRALCRDFGGIHPVQSPSRNN